MTAPAERFLRYEVDPVRLAQRLLGQRLVRVIDGTRLAGTITEVEAYLGAEDAAAHTFRGRRTPRNASMYLPGGHAYVYFTYGMHFCLNVVCGKVDEGVAVLIRGLEPTEGVARMYANRPAARRDADLCSGPAKITQALAIDREFDGIDLRTCPLLFIERARDRSVSAARIERTPRIGVDYAGKWAAEPLRFVMKGIQSSAGRAR